MGRKSSCGVQEQSPGSGFGRQGPPEVEAFQHVHVSLMFGAESENMVSVSHKVTCCRVANYDVLL